MRIAILSDIHANLLALQEVLDAIDALAPDSIWCLGDIVGYGPEPQACVDVIRKRAAVCLAGNHDLAVVGSISLEQFNPVARTAAEWQRPQIDADATKWLAGLPGRTVAEGVTLVHGSPRDPIWEYLDNQEGAAQNVRHFDTHLCLFGHSHQALAWRICDGKTRRLVQMLRGGHEESLSLDIGARWLLNPGSAGQPRDGDGRASFALLDIERVAWTWFRVPYDIDMVERAIVDAGLPDLLGKRLHQGW